MDNVTNAMPIDGYITAASPLQNTIVFDAEGKEMLKIAPDGFYVRGVKLKQDSDEARAVYDAFVSWLRTTGHMV